MKRTLITLAALFACSLAFAQENAVPDWENPQVNGIGRLDSHTYALPLASVKDALTDELEPATPFRKSLNGDWKISWCGDPARRPMDFFKPEFDDSSWQTIDVPSCVEMRGFGSPGYTNVDYPHAAQPPVIRDRELGTADYNPVSSYRTEFTVPDSWKGRRVILRFDGVYSAYYVWINGQKAGYAEDSKLPSEFDITGLLKKGDNTLAVEVYRWCDGSYLEDQDMFRFSGIYRDVTLLAVPDKGVDDFIFTTRLDKTYRNATVGLDIVTASKSASAELYDADFKLVGRFKGKKSSLEVKDAHLWSAEEPYLYTLVVKAGKDIRSAKVGIKQVETSGNTVLVNGKPVKFKGVNRHEHSAQNGRTLTLDDMLADITLMKRFNINTVRTSHYPDHHLWYDLCDRYGIYVMAEANVEGHEMGYGEKGMGRFEEWNKTIVERNVNNVLNYRNHACVTFWSVGNETGHGKDFENAIDAIHAMDFRPVHWERGNKVADVDSRMYPSVEWLYERGRLGDGIGEPMEDFYKDEACVQSALKPFFLCEYAHSMGNALGNFQEYWDAFYSSDSLLGGCIWDWVDQALEKNTTRFHSDGKPVTVMAYGGDWDEQPNDGPFCCNGVIRPDRSVSAKLIEVGHVYRQIVLSSDDAASGKGMLWNRFDFTDITKYDATWELLEDGLCVSSGSWTVPYVAPRAKAEVQLPKPDYSFKAGKEYFLNVSFSLRDDEIWAPKGHVVASDQLAWNNGPVQQCRAAACKDVNVAEDGCFITVSSDSYKAVFCRKSGTLSSLEVGGKQILANGIHGVAGPRLTCQRAFTDNDCWIRDGWDGHPWRAYGLTQLHDQAKGILVERQENGDVKVVSNIDVTGSKSAGFDYTATWTFGTDGTIIVCNTVSPYGHQPQALPRLGLSWLLDKSLENVEWYGRGPAENYIDRCTGSFIGRYESTVTGLFEDYVRPQDNGYRSDVRWVEFTDADGKGVRFSADFPMFVQALHYDYEDLMHARQLNGEARINAVKEPREEICLNLDLRQLGLGGASCGPKPMDKYIFPIKPETFSIVMEAATR